MIQLLGEMARKSRYPSRHAYIAYHLPHLAARWIEAGLPIVNRNTLDTASLFELQELMAPSKAALHDLRVRATDNDLRPESWRVLISRELNRTPHGVLLLRDANADGTVACTLSYQRPLAKEGTF